nr:hypothetical protein [Leptospiraceae bacterium]
VCLKIQTNHCFHCGILDGKDRFGSICRKKGTSPSILSGASVEWKKWQEFLEELYERDWREK